MYSCIDWTGRRNCNIDGHSYTPALGLALVETLRACVGRDDVWLGNYYNWPMAPWLHGLVDSLGGHKLWCDHRIFMHAPRAGTPEEARDLYMAIRECACRKVIVGPASLQPVRRFFADAPHVVTPEINGWNRIDAVTAKTEAVVQAGDVVLVAFGMPAEPLIHRMLSLQPHARYFDVGSGMDPMAGRHTRAHQPLASEMQRLYPGLLC
jgi:hypothetical protein